jgi:GDPmannose 4,6-dehydratase
MKMAIIVGAAGQDGRLLQPLLESRGYTVTGITKTGVRGPSASRPEPFSVSEFGQVSALLETVKPAEIYYLAAHHHSSQDRPENSSDLLRQSFATHVLYLSHFLYAIRDVSPRTKLFYASSSLIFGNPVSTAQNEDTEFRPRSSYALSKLAGMLLCRQFAEEGVFAASGILYNHESLLRGDQFISKRIISAAVAGCRGRPVRLEIGMLDAVVDWGYAPDFVDAMHRILSLGEPRDFVVATGTPHTVREFAALAFGAVGLDYRDFVHENPALLKQPAARLIGDPSRLMAVTGWQPSVSFQEMVQMLVTEAKRNRV